jgi:6-phosphogluconolactonase
MTSLEIVSSDIDFIQSAVNQFIKLANRNIEDKGVFTVALSGGGTPRPVYAALGDPVNSSKVDWPKVHLFWGDERPVPPSDPESNFRMVKEVLLDQIAIPESNVHRVHAELDVRIAAFEYEEELRQFFGGEWPDFDLVFLGMGEDGHTASLFPRSAGLNEDYRWFIANFAPSRNTWRLTLTANAINAAHFMLVLIKGKKKAEMVKTVLTGPQNPQEYPIQMIHPEKGEMVWLVDEGAASELTDDLKLT